MALVILVGFVLQQANFMDLSLGFTNKEKFVHIQIHGNSMRPILKNGSTYKAYKAESYGVGDIVVFDILGSEDPFIKWLAGEPGDKVSFDGKQMFINGKIATDYSCKDNGSRLCNQFNEMCGANYTECGIPAGNCLVLANQRGSQDSLTFGLIQCSKIKYIIDQ